MLQIEHTKTIGEFLLNLQGFRKTLQERHGFFKKINLAIWHVISQDYFAKSSSVLKALEFSYNNLTLNRIT